jgi:hypothetical protein
VRLARTAFRGDVSLAVVAWDVGYILVLSAVLLAFARQAARRRLTT